MDFQITVIAVGLAREQAFQLALGRYPGQGLQRLFGLGLHIRVAFLGGKFQQFAGIRKFAFHPAKTIYGGFQPGALAHDFLGPDLVVPQVGVFGQGVQFGQSFFRRAEVKDASSAIPVTA